MSALILAGCGGHAALQQPPAAVVPADPAAIRRSQFAAKADSLLADSSLARAAVAAYIVEADGRQQEIYARNKSQLLTPASVNKLFVTAAALRQWGPYHRFPTQALGDSIDARGRVNGDLYLKGFGAPDLKTSDLDRLAFALKAKGLRLVAGSIVTDASYFDTTAFGAGWMWDEGPYAYNAPVAALSLNGNAFDLGINHGLRPGSRLSVELDPVSSYFMVDNKGHTGQPGSRRSLRANRALNGARDEVRITGALAADAAPLFLSRSVSNPGCYCATMFREALLRRGIRIMGTIMAGTAPDSLPVLSAVNSRPLYAIIQDMNKESDNFIAEMLFRNLNQASTASPSVQPDSLAIPDTSRNAVSCFLNGLGCQPGTFTVADGSGLSRYNLCSPEQLVRTLLAIYQDPILRPELLVSLPVSGVDGTLSMRFREGDSRMRVRAKTGTMTGVSCLAGFAWGPEERVYCFALMFNNYTAKATDVRPVQDELLRELLFTAP